MAASLMVTTMTTRMTMAWMLDNIVHVATVVVPCRSFWMTEVVVAAVDVAVRNYCVHPPTIGLLN